MATGSQIKIGSSLLVPRSTYTLADSFPSLVSGSGIAQGAANWGDSTTLVNFGGQVYNNTFGGTHLTFALSLAGVKDWKTTGNTAIDSTLFKGTPGSNCHGLGGTVSPQFAMLDPYKTSNLDLGTDANCWTRQSSPLFKLSESYSRISADAGGLSLFLFRRRRGYTAM